MKFRVRFGLIAIAAALVGSLALGAMAQPRLLQPTAGPKTIVYGTDTGKKYHRGTCEVFNQLEGRPGGPAFQAKSKIKMTLAEATKKYGPKGPCALCSPPRLAKNAAAGEEPKKDRETPMEPEKKKAG